MKNNTLLYGILLISLQILVGCDFKFPHNIYVQPNYLVDSLVGLPEYSPKNESITFAIKCPFDSVRVFKKGTFKQVPCKTHGNRCIFLMPGYEVSIFVFGTDKQPNTNQNIVSQPTNNQTPINNSKPKGDKPKQVVDNQKPKTNNQNNTISKVNDKTTQKKVDSITVSFNLLLENGEFARAIDTKNFVYKRRFAKGEKVDLAFCAPKVLPEVQDIKFCGWATSATANNGAFNYTFTQNVTLYAVWQLPKPKQPIEGTPQNPIKICTVSDLKLMEGSTQCFILMNDLIINSSLHRISKFSGTFDGNGKSIVVGNKNYFIKTNEGTIKNVKLHIKSSGCMLCNTNRGIIDGIVITLENTINEINNPIITYTNYGTIGKRITKQWSRGKVKENRNILYVYNK